MKTEILNTIKNPNLSDAEKFNILFDFYKKSPSKNRNLEAVFNRVGYTAHYLSKLAYEVRQVFKISDTELFQHQYQNESEQTITSEEDNNVDASKEEDSGNNSSEEPSLPLREEFSFLNNEDCPEEFKILVADKISAYNKMTAGRGALDDPNTPEENKAELAQAVAEADQLNSLIYDELKHYQVTGEILGKHPIFTTHNLKKEIELMTAEQKVQRVETLKGLLRTNKSNLTKAENSGNTAKAKALAQKIKQLETERDLVIKSIEKTSA